MIIVRVELHSAITGQVTELARMDICNIGGSAERGDYQGRVYRGRDTAALDRRQVHKTATLHAYPRLSLHVWNLVGLMLTNLGYRR